MSKDKVLKLTKYVEGLKQRLDGNLDPELRKVLEIDLKKSTNKLEQLKLGAK